MPVSLHPISAFEVPEDFPVQLYLDIHRRVVAFKQPNSDERAEFFYAWTAVAYRYKACADHDAAYSDSIRRVGNTANFPDRYIQDQELFNFFVTGLSTIDCLYYGCYALGSMLDPSHFPFSRAEDKRRVNTSRTSDAFQQAFGGRIATTLQSILNSPEYDEWKTVRNILTHRTSPGRLISLSVGGAPQTPPYVEWKTIGIQFDGMTTVSRRKWLVDSVDSLVTAASMLPI
jgi:hypothetical protein